MQIPAFCCLLFLLCAPFQSSAQDPFPENTFRTSTNKLYWKNKLPYPGYWQQDVHYRIKAELNDGTHAITATEELTYWNNSPDTLRFVYFHLYQNAFQPGSYNDDLNRRNNVTPVYGQYEKKGLNTVVREIRSNNVRLRSELDNTILKVYLSAPLPPRSSVKFDINFTSFFDGGNIRRRMKLFGHNGYKHFDGVLWYPRIAVYDRHGGWHADQHLGREFYGDYGTFDVSLTLPSHYVLEGTGVLINEKEVLPDTLRAKLDLKNFAGKKAGTPPTVIIPPDGKTKTWRFHAENVHDFAWTADPTYRIGEKVWNGVRCIALAQEEVASQWQSAPDFIARVIEIYSRDFGMYEYPKIIVADARDGMEYPMLTLCGGREPDFHDVIAHEVGHQWFYGMIGNNETYRAFLDEGFTQFLTIWSLNRIDGDYEIRTPPASKYIHRYYQPQPTREARLVQPYLRHAVTDEPVTINTHSDQFNGAVGHGGGYGMVYYKGGTMLLNLQYVLGDTLFQNAMKHYVRQWKMCHPYPEDFRNSISGYTKQNLDWFFDEWIETTKVIDYRVKSVMPGDSAGKYIITFERKGSMQMPLDFTVTRKDGKKFKYIIPNTDFVKADSATALKPWIGWDIIKPTYKAEVNINGKLKDVEIDPTYRLADVNLMNNRKRKPIQLKWENLVISPADRRYYTLYWRPDLWFNDVDGFKAGANLQGSYFNQKQFLHLTAWVNTGIAARPELRDQENTIRDIGYFIFQYTNDLNSLSKGLTGQIQVRSVDGLFLSRVGLTKDLNKNYSFHLAWKAMIRQQPEDRDYLFFPDQWKDGLWNNTANAELRHLHRFRRSYGSWSIRTRTTAPGSDYAYGSVTGEVQHYFGIHKLHLRTRTIAQWISGRDIPFESLLYTAGANNEEMMENKFTRARGIIPDDLVGSTFEDNHFQAGGGLNLRGYGGRVLLYSRSGQVTDIFSTSAGGAVNLEIDFTRYLPFRPRLTRNWLGMSTYLFADAGMVNKALPPGRILSFTSPLADAGAGLVLSIKKWGPFQKANPLHIRVDFPIFVSTANIFTNESSFAFRWLLGINRTF